jgi:hypothetical protein
LNNSVVPSVSYKSIFIPELFYFINANPTVVYLFVYLTCHVFFSAVLPFLSVTQQLFTDHNNASSLYNELPVDMISPQVPLSVTQVTAAQQFLAYHGASFSAHQQHFNNLYPKGWHMITLSMYGDLLEQLYAAVWVPFDTMACILMKNKTPNLVTT